MIEDDGNDEDLEAELASLAAGNDTGYKSRRNSKLIKLLKNLIAEIYRVCHLKPSK